MADSRYSLPKVTGAGSKAAMSADALNRQLQAVEADIHAGRLPDAAAMLNQLVSAHPDDARMYVAGWLLANKANNPDAALQSAQRAVALSPLSGTAHYCLSDSLNKRGDIDGARKAITQALTFAPQNLQFRELAVNLANAQADHVAAEALLRAAYAQKPDIPGIKTMIGNALRYQDKLDESKPWLLEGVALNPDDADAHHGLAVLAYLGDKPDEAKAHLDQALRVRPADEGFLYLRAILAGETPAQQPEAMTRSLFDRYASKFDTHLVGALKYRVPQMISKMILERFPARKFNLLDLGCGTGLVGAALGPIEGYMVGVDLSVPMLEEAKKHNVYSRLHSVNLLDALDATDANEYEVIVAADVFVYLGDLSAAIRDSFKVLRSGGWLIFSCEAAPDDGPDFVLRKSMRYAQSAAYIKRLLAENGFILGSIEEKFDLRTDHGVGIPGFLVAAQKPV
jgi:predicted TPR repeat methyltransferase